MPEKWEKVKLSDVATIKYGKDHKKLDDGKIPVYGTGGVMRYVDTPLYGKKSVLIPRKGSLGNLFFVEKPFWTVDTLFYTEIDENRIIPEYLYYKLKTFDLANMNVGSAVPSLTTAILNPIEFELPPIEVQSEIAKTLGVLDKKIESNKEINHHLAEMAESIWKEKYANLKPNSTLGNFFPIITGKKDANVARGGQYPFFSCSQGISYTDAYSFEGNAILLAGNGDFNVKTYNGKFEAYQRTYVLIPNNEYRLGFLYYAIKHFLSDITAGDRGSVIKYITKGDIENLNLYMPDDESDFELFNQFVSNTAQNNAEIERLTETRDTLLPKLMSGELSVID